MIREHFSWKRYWFPHNEEIPYDDQGFFLHPGIVRGTIFESLAEKLCELDNLEQSRCVILLGDPGLGKTWSVRTHVKSLIASGTLCKIVAFREHENSDSVIHDALKSNDLVTSLYGRA